MGDDMISGWYWAKLPGGNVWRCVYWDGEFAHSNAELSVRELWDWGDRIPYPGEVEPTRFRVFMAVESLGLPLEDQAPIIQALDAALTKRGDV